MAGTTQADARAAAIAAGASPSAVDAFIAKEGEGKAGGAARVSYQRITSAFDVKGSVGTNNLDAFHAQKAAAAGQDASAKGTYLSGATGSGGGGAPTAPSAPGIPPSMAALNKVVVPDTTAQTPLPTAGGPMGGDGGGGGGAGVSASVLPTGTGLLRPLGRRMPPMDSMAVAGLGRRVY